MNSHIYPHCGKKWGKVGCFSKTLLSLLWWFIFFYNSMALFTSEYECKLDAKGRLVLPAKIKANLPEASGNQLFVMKGMDSNLVLYPQLEFEKVQEEFTSLSDYDSSQRKLKRDFFRRVNQVDLDSTGRFLIPRSWIDHAQLEKNVIVLGVGSTIEIWNPELYKDYLTEDNEEYSDLARKHLK